MKLVTEERETRALHDWLAETERTLVCSDLVRTELRRAVGRAAPERAPAVRDLLAALTLIGLTSAQLDDAGRLAPPAVRTLDAIHLSVALLVGDDLDGLLTYDGRMRSAAEAAGLPCVAPGA